MDNTLILIIVIVAVIIILWIMLKPYIIRYDTTIAFTGGLGSGKSLNSVKIAITLLRKQRAKIKLKNTWIKIKNIYHKIRKQNKEKLIKKPNLYSNIPIKINKKEWSKKLTKEMLTFNTYINEYSIVLIDELPQLCNQFNWSIKEVKGNMNEFITFFRHYIGGYFIVNAQSIDDIVVQIRRKLNTYYWCYNFKKLLCFYKVQICSIQTSDQITTTTSTIIEDNTRNKYGILTKKYASRCYKKRYLEHEFNEKTPEEWREYYTKEIITFEKDYKSPLSESKKWQRDKDTI